MRATAILLTMTLTVPAAEPIKPPAAKVAPKTFTLHGDTRTDNYFWLREKTNPEVIQYLEDENHYTEAVMKDTEGLQKKLYEEILGRIKETDTNVPARQGEYFYYTRTEKGKQYPINCRKRVGTETEEILLDQNELAKGQKYWRVGALRPSFDQRLIAYSYDTKGDENYSIVMKDLSSGKLLSDEVGNNQGVVQWANDNKTLFYVTLDEAKRPFKVWRHTLGTKQADDKLIYHEADERFFLEISKSRSRRFVFISAGSKNSTEVRYLDANQPNGDFKVILPRENEVEYDVEDQGDSFYIRTNEHAKNFRLVKAPISDPSRKNWKEVLPHRPDVKLDGADAFQNHLVVYERENGLSKVRVEDLRTGKVHHVSFPEPAYTVMPVDNFTYETNQLRFRYTSLVTPGSVYDYNLDTQHRELLKRDEVIGGYDPDQYVSERIFATAGDGTKIPIALVHKKGAQRDGKAPLYLYAYGSYGLNSEPHFDTARLSLLNRGFTYAIATIRGGSEMGEQWHDQGKMLHKKNTFTDFIDAAQYLVNQKYTSPDRLVIMGGSAGGLLMGAVTNMRPDLFKVVIAKVPFVDVMNTMLDPSLPLTVTEYEEWGNPNEAKYYNYMRSYSPYDNVQRKAYPNMLVTAGLNDPRVSYWEPAKWVAKLRTMKTDDNTLLLKTNMGSGHFGASGRYERIKETAFEYAFILKMLGI